MSNANRMRTALPLAQPEALQVAVRSAMPLAMHERNGLTKNYHLNLGFDLTVRTARARTPNPLFSLPFVGRFAPRPAVIHRAGVVA
jgi:hypothetical protein